LIYVAEHDACGKPRPKEPSMSIARKFLFVLLAAVIITLAVG
jgi:hypothetical protein